MRGGGDCWVLYEKEGVWKVVEEISDMNVRERCNSVHFDERVTLASILWGRCFDRKIRGKLDYISETLGSPWEIWRLHLTIIRYRILMRGHIGVPRHT